MALRRFVLFAVVMLVLSCSFQRLHSAKDAVKKDSESEEIDELEALLDEEEKSATENVPAEEEHEQEEEELGNYEGFDGLEGEDDDFSMPAVDDKDVVVLKDGNFSDFISKNRYVMVEFYAPWCGHCQSLAPEYAAAATELKGEVSLAKVDATEENDLSQKYDVQGFPTIIFFIDGVHKPYPGQRTKEGILSWIKRKTGPSVLNLTTAMDAETVMEAGNTVAVALFDSLEGPENEEFAAASRLEDDLFFYQTTSERVAAVLNIDSKVKRPALFVLKKEPEKISHFDGNFEKGAIANFIFANKLPLVITFTRESASSIFESSVKKQILLFVTAKDYEKIIPAFQEAAKFFKGKVPYVHILVASSFAFLIVTMQRATYYISNSVDAFIKALGVMSHFFIWGFPAIFLVVTTLIGGFRLLVLVYDLLIFRLHAVFNLKISVSLIVQFKGFERINTSM